MAPLASHLALALALAPHLAPLAPLALAAPLGAPLAPHPPLAHPLAHALAHALAPPPHALAHPPAPPPHPLQSHPQSQPAVPTQPDHSPSTRLAPLPESTSPNPAKSPQGPPAAPPLLQHHLAPAAPHFRKIWHTGSQSSPLSRPRNPSLLYDPLAPAPPHHQLVDALMFRGLAPLPAVLGSPPAHSPPPSQGTLVLLGALAGLVSALGLAPPSAPNLILGGLVIPLIVDRLPGSLARSLTARHESTLLLLLMSGLVLSELRLIKLPPPLLLGLLSFKFLPDRGENRLDGILEQLGLLVAGLVAGLVASLATLVAGLGSYAGPGSYALGSHGSVGSHGSLLGPGSQTGSLLGSLGPHGPHGSISGPHGSVSGPHGSVSGPASSHHPLALPRTELPPPVARLKKLLHEMFRPLLVELHMKLGPREPGAPLDLIDLGMALLHNNLLFSNKLLMLLVLLAKRNLSLGYPPYQAPELLATPEATPPYAGRALTPPIKRTSSLAKLHTPAPLRRSQTTLPALAARAGDLPGEPAKLSLGVVLVTLLLDDEETASKRLRRE